MASIAHIAANPPPEFVYVTRSDDLATVASTSSTACWLWTLPGRPRVIPTSMETMSIGYVLRPLREAGQQSGAGWLDVSEECNGPGAKRKANGVCFCACTIQRYRATALARSQIHSVRMCPEASSQHAEPRGVAYLGLWFSSVWSCWLFLPFKELFFKKKLSDLPATSK